MYLASGNMNNVIHERAVCKAFAKIEMLGHLIQTDERNLAIGSYGGDISLDQWQYIAELIEKSNKIE
jgi:hypothetical protein